MESVLEGRLELLNCEFGIGGLFFRMRDRRCISRGISSGVAARSWRNGPGVGGRRMSDLLKPAMFESAGRPDCLSMNLKWLQIVQSSAPA